MSHWSRTCSTIILLLPKYFGDVFRDEVYVVFRPNNKERHRHEWDPLAGK